jgi:hypothetical protein
MKDKKAELVRGIGRKPEAPTTVNKPVFFLGNH